MKNATTKEQAIKSLNKSNVDTLRATAKKEGVTIPAKSKKADIVEMLASKFFPVKPDGKADALKLSKSAKKATSTSGKLAATFQALKSAHDNKEKVKGITMTMWKSNTKRGDYDGMTVRFNDKQATGIDRAIVHNIRKALKGLGLDLSCFTLRASGSAALYVK